MRKYETIYIIDPAVEGASLDGVVEKYNGVIHSYGGKVLRQDRWGARNLAYPLKKKNQGFYVYTLFEGKNQALTELERAFRIDENILRHLTIVLEKKQLIAVEKELAAQAQLA